MTPIRSLHEDRAPRVQAMLLGHIRLGTFTGRAPQESPTLIFTASDQSRLKALAKDFGGEITDYAPQGAGTERWRLISETDSLTALFPFPDVEGNVTQDFEMWGRGGIKRRCDGVEATIYNVDEETGEVTTEEAPCVCEATDKLECAPVTRVNLLLPQTGLGIWTLRTQSKIAAIHLWDQARFINELSGGRMNHIPVRVVWAPREIHYFDQKAKKRRSTTKRVVSLSIAGDAERTLRALSLPADRALIETVRSALEDAGRTLELPAPPSASTGPREIGAGESPSAREQGKDADGEEEPPPKATGQTESPAGRDPEADASGGGPPIPTEDPKESVGPFRGKHWSEIAVSDPGYLEQIIQNTRSAKRKELARFHLDAARPRLA